MQADVMLSPVASPALVRRINQLYHDLTQDEFDAEHCYRHRVEAAFWRQVARVACTPARNSSHGRVIVDLACGSGFVTQILGAGLRPDDRLMAIDVSTGALRHTARKWSSTPRAHSPRFTCLAGDGQSLPLPNESVDLFAVNAALHHMPNVGAVLGEIDRVLKPGGWFALGFEPNLHHFSSLMSSLSRGFDRLAWYASPRQNARRVRQLLTPGDASHRHPAAISAERVARAINTALSDEQYATEPLTPDALLNLVDAHARGAEQSAGFDPASLLQRYFPRYHVARLVTSDYLGETPRRCRPFREAADATMRLMWPAHGSLFSWLVCKNVAVAHEGEGTPCPR